MIYRICDIVIESSTLLPELPPAPGMQPDIVFRHCPTVKPVRRECQWFHQWSLPEGETGLSLGKEDSGFLLRFPDMADFEVSFDGTEIRCYPEAGIPMDTIRHLLLDQVLPLALSNRGRLVLHGSAVMTDDGVVAFVGASGQGKSTLASFFASHGFPAMTDDCLVLDERDNQLVAVPYYPGFRLWGASIEALFENSPVTVNVAGYTDKKRVGFDNAGETPAGPVPLRRVYFMRSQEEIAETADIDITPMSQREAFMSLVSFAFKLDIANRNMLRNEFELLSRLSSLPLFFRLTFPHNFSLLPKVREAILKHLQADNRDALQNKQGSLQF